MRILEGAGDPLMIAGSFASTAHGLPRTTQDLDIVIDPPDERALDALLRSMPPDEYYVDADMARDAFRRRSMFNVVGHSSGWKVDGRTSVRAGRRQAMSSTQGDYLQGQLDELKERVRKLEEGQPFDFADLMRRLERLEGAVARMAERPDAT